MVKKSSTADSTFMFWGLAVARMLTWKLTNDKPKDTSWLPELN